MLLLLRVTSTSIDTGELDERHGQRAQWHDLALQLPCRVRHGAVAGRRVNDVQRAAHRARERGGQVGGIGVGEQHDAFAALLLRQYQLLPPIQLS